MYVMYIYLPNILPRILNLMCVFMLKSHSIVMYMVGIMTIRWWFLHMNTNTNNTDLFLVHAYLFD